MVKFSALFALSFRPFFLLTAASALILLALWLAHYYLFIALPLGWAPLQWHSHEFLYGFVGAAIAGFLLTAITNWTATPPLSGWPLFALVVLWFAGRVVMVISQLLTPMLVAAVDLAFFTTLLLYVATVIVRFQNYRNLILLLVLGLLTLGNGLMHWGFVTSDYHALILGQHLGFDVIALMIVVIAGRITPAFSVNWLRKQGASVDAERIVRSSVLDRMTLAAMVAVAVADIAGATTMWLAVIVAVAACLNLLRVMLWKGWLVRAEPMLWILHVAYVFMVLALVARVLSLTLDRVPASVWYHAMGVGGIGVLILAVMTRVALGHTGRVIKLAGLGLWIYPAIILAALLRVVTAMQWLDTGVGIALSAMAWFIAFTLFLVLYWPVLSQPRVDGRPG